MPEQTWCCRGRFALQVRGTWADSRIKDGIGVIQRKLGGKRGEREMIDVGG